jgi:cytochrome b561
MKYALSSRILHWTMSLAIFIAIAIGIYMKNSEFSDIDQKIKIYELHKSFGVVVLLLIFIRIINRFIFKAPPLPNSINKFEIKLAKTTHFLLYVLMLIVPLSGYLMSIYGGFVVKLFGIQMPHFISQGDFSLAEFFNEAHEILAYSLIFLIILHILGAIKHRFFDKKENNIINRII